MPKPSCACPHPIYEHGSDGCLHPDPAGGLNFCPCETTGYGPSREAMFTDMEQKLRDIVHEVVRER